MNFQPVLDSLGKILSDLLDFIPRLINGLIILIVGYLICRVIRWILRRILQSVRLNQITERIGVSDVVKGLGVKTPLSEILVQIVFFFLLLSFVTSAVRLMGLLSVAELLDNVLRFVPRAISAALLLIFGSLIARFLGNTLTTIAQNVNITYSGALGKILEYGIVIFTAVLAISTLGVDTTVLTTSLTIIVASVGLALALTFGLGSREAARNVIAGHYVRQTFVIGQEVTVGQYTGVVRATAGAYTTLELDQDQENQVGEAGPPTEPPTMNVSPNQSSAGDGRRLRRVISVPNALMLEAPVLGTLEEL